jgi:hypothetical protein
MDFSRDAMGTMVVVRSRHDDRLVVERGIRPPRRSRPAPVRLASAVLFLLSLASCGDGGSVVTPGPATFLFGTRGLPDAEGQFAAVTSDPQVIATLQSQLRMGIPDRNLHIDGPIAPGNGGHNLSWSWHFVPDGWDAVEISAEVCDGTPQAVEADVSGWVKNVGTFCPWGSFVQRRL